MRSRSSRGEKTSPLARRGLLALTSQRGLSKRSACRILGFSRRVACYRLRQPEKDRAVTDQLMSTSQRFPRFGYRRAAAWLQLGETRIRRVWRQVGLQLPKRRPRRRRCGSDFRLPGAPRPNTVWIFDFVHDQLAYGTGLKMVCVLDEHTREFLGIEVARWLRYQDVILTLSRLMEIYGKPQHICSDNGKLRDECLNRVWFRDAREARVVIEKWRHFYNHQRPHSALGYRTPAAARQDWINENKIDERLTA